MFGRASTGFPDRRLEHRDGEHLRLLPTKPEEMLKPDEIASVKAFLAKQPEVTGSRERIVFAGCCTARAIGARIRRHRDGHGDLRSRLHRSLLCERLQVGTGEADACAASWYEYEQEKYVDVGSRYVFLLPNREGEFVDRFITVKGGIDFRTMPKTRWASARSTSIWTASAQRSATRKPTPPRSSASSPTRARRQGPAAGGRFLAKEHPRLKVVSWREYAPIMSEIVVGFDVMMKSIEAILILICVLLVVKLTTFSIIERYSEIGTMRALGFTRTDITWQFALEGFLVVAAGQRPALCWGRSSSLSCTPRESATASPSSSTSSATASSPVSTPPRSPGWRPCSPRWRSSRPSSPRSAGAGSRS